MFIYICKTCDHLWESARLADDPSNGLVGLSLGLFSGEALLEKGFLKMFLGREALLFSSLKSLAVEDVLSPLVPFLVSLEGADSKSASRLASLARR